MESLQHTPLGLDSFSATVRKHVDPASPPPLRMMAAKAMAPMPPLELASALYQLRFDPESRIRDAATQSLGELPGDILDAVVGATALDPRVLDLFAQHLVGDERRLERLVLNTTVDDRTIAWLAERVGEATSEIIAGIHTRLLRTPAIIEALYVNPNARMSTIDKVVDLARRNNVTLAGLPALQQALALGAEYDDGQSENEVSDRVFTEVLRTSDDQAELDADEERLEKLLAGEEAAATEQEERRLSRWQIIQKMNAAQKIRLAMLGGAEDRNILLRDARRVVHMAAVQSPKLTMGEVTKLAGNRGLPASVVEYIARNREWTRYYPVLLGLINNPKTPLSESVGFLKQLRLNDLRNLQRNKNVPTQLARQAQLIYRQKAAGRGH